VLTDYAIKVENHYSKKAGYQKPMDMEWAKDGIDGHLYMVQARPETVFIAFFMLVGGFFWTVHTFQYARRSVMDWLKPLVLIVVGSMMLYSPEQSVAALGLFLSFYLMMDAFSSFSMAQVHYPSKGWGWMFVNGTMSVLLAIIFLIGWPQSSLWLVGLFVAISLFFDGLALVMIGWTAKDI